VRDVKPAFFRKRTAKAGVSTIIGGVMIFAILFTVGYSYFYILTQSQQTYQNSLAQSNAFVLQQRQENLQVSATVSPTSLTFGVSNNGITTSIATYFIINVTSNPLYNGNILYSQKYTTPQPISEGGSFTFPTYACGSSCSKYVYLVKVTTTRGNVFTATASESTQTSTNAQQTAISAGAIGDLYLTFGTYTYYVVTTHSSSSSCPGSSTNASYSNYCLETASGDTGPGFAVPAAQTGVIAFGVNVTDLNSQSDDIILDQFTLMYQNELGGGSGSHPEWIIWSVASVGAKSGSYIPILNDFYLQDIPYDVPKTIYFVTTECVTSGNGPTTENSACETVSSNAPSNTRSTMNAPAIANVFLLTNGWELAPGSYTVTQGLSNSLVYTGTGIACNYAQNIPYVSTLWE
jgi:hypothetical protein